VIVMTRRPAEPRRHGEELFAGTVAELVVLLGDAKRVYIDGGSVIGQFFAAGLVDDVTLSIVPVVLGDGIRLFSGGELEHRLVLESHHTWPSGLVQLRYRVAKPT
jgi:dihydrofolate reductase